MRLRSILLPGLAAAIVAAVALIAAGPSSTTTAPPPRAVASGTNVVIAIANYAYSPDVPTVKAGTTITVTNRDMTQHTLTANDGGFDTGTLQSGQTKRITAPRKPGTYPYHCAFHAFMVGTIKVVD